jgi:predicted membrane protein
VEQKSNNMKEENTKLQNRGGNKIAGGVIIVGIGVALLLRNMGLLLPNWLFTWPMILIIIGIYSGFKHNFRHNSWLILIAIGSFFLIQDFIPELHLAAYFWPLVIIGIGIIYIIRPRNDSWGRWRDGHHAYRRKQRQSWAGFANEESVDSNDEFSISSIFSGVKRNIISKNFKRGQIRSIFGGAEIDMTQADMTEPSFIKLEVIFGGVSLVVPSNWSVQNEVDGLFHGVEDKRYNPSVTMDPNKVLVLKGNCVFGGIEIKSY